MKKILIPLIFILIISTSLLTACSGAAFTPNGWAGLTVDHETAYLAYSQYIYAINVADGVEKWRYPAKPDAKTTFFSPPVLTNDGQLLVSSYGNKLISLNPATGGENWTFPSTNHFIGSPLVVGETIFAPCADNILYVIDLKGTKLWEFTAGGPLWTTPITDSENKHLFFTSMDHKIYALDIQTHELLWSKDLGSALLGTPALSQDGILYIGTFDKQMIAINSQDRSILWQSKINGWVWAGPILDEATLYFGDLSGYFYAMKTDGTTTWSLQPDGPITSSPLVTEAGIYFTTEAGTVYAVDRLGKPLWNQPIKVTIYSSPVLAGDVILITPQGGDSLLVALNLNGSPKWSYTPAKK